MSVPTSHIHNHLNNKVIVVVDDDEDIGALIIELIHEHLPHDVQHHLTGNQALQAMATTVSHLFILDNNLPDMSGLELHDRLHAFEHLRNAPTLLISAVRPPLREIQKRAITFLAKPFDVTELLHTIIKLLT